MQYRYLPTLRLYSITVSVFLFVIFTAISLSHPSISAAQNPGSFTCGCDVYGGSTCEAYYVSADSCSTGYTANPNACLTSPSCQNGLADTCEAQCIQEAQIIPYAYGTNCPANDPRAACQPDPNDPTVAVTCRPSTIFNITRCLKDREALNNHIQCRDHSECVGYLEEGVCAFPPNVSTYMQCYTNPSLEGLVCQSRDGGIVVCFAPGQTAPPIPDPTGPGPIVSPPGNVPTWVGIHCQNDETLNTAVGCIRIGNITDMMAFFLRWSLGLAGGIATVLIVYAGIKFALSQGDPKKIQAAKELFISSISGLLMLIFSVFLLRVIGVDILNIL